MQTAQKVDVSSASVQSVMSTNAALQNAVAMVKARVNEENAALDDNVSISASQRFAIMQKLMRKNEESQVCIWFVVL